MKNLLRIVMLVLIVGAVFFSSDFLMNQNEKYDLNESNKVEEINKPDVSDTETEEEQVVISGDFAVSGDIEVSGDTVDVDEKFDSGDMSGDFEPEIEESVLESGDENFEIEDDELSNELLENDLVM